MATPAPDPQIVLLTNLMTRLTDIEERRRTTAPRPKAIQCRTFKIGDNWPNFAAHFAESVKAAHGLTNVDVDGLNAACLSWIASKLEPGPTLSTFKNLTAEERRTWPNVNAALTSLFADETEREHFLADPASFKRGKRSLLEYKTELGRLMDTHLPNLRGVAVEFQRQAATRFIEGLDDDKLKRKLRRHCKKENCTLDAAYEFALNYETSNVQTRIREGESAVLEPSAKGLSILEKPKVSSLSPNEVSGSANQPNGSSEVRKLQRDLESMASKQKITEMRVQELSAKSAHTNDRVDCIAKQVGQLSENMTKLENTVGSRFDKLEQLITGNAPQNPNHGYNQYNPGQYGYRSYGRGQNRGNFRGPAPSIRPSLTGGVGYVNRPVRPTSFRMQEPGSNIPVRASSAIQPSGGTAPVAVQSSGPTTTPTAAAAASAAAAIEHPRADPAAQCYEEPSWWSPGMQEMGAMGYDEGYEGTYSYGGQDFYAQ